MENQTHQEILVLKAARAWAAHLRDQADHLEKSHRGKVQTRQQFRKWAYEIEEAIREIEGLPPKVTEPISVGGSEVPL